LKLGYPLHWSIATRLLLAWVILSPALGAASYYFESRQIDTFLFNLAAQAAMHFNNSETEAAFLADVTRHRPMVETYLKESRFAGIRLFGRDQQLKLETWKAGIGNVLNRIERHRHTFPDAEETHYNKIWEGEDLYVQVVIPLLSPNKKVYGYFEGVYEIDATTIEALRQRIINSLLIVVVVIGLTSFVLYPVILHLNREATDLSDELLQSHLELLQSLGSAIAERDSDTDAHNYRVTLYTISLAEAMHMSREDIKALIVGAFLHDVGKIGITDQILLKPGRLTPAEFEIMKTHVILGSEIIQHSNWLKCARDVVLYHHEKFDGTGYPQGLHGDAIPLNARLFAVVDVFDALTSRRPYKEPHSFTETMKTLCEGSGKHFDPDIIANFELVAFSLYCEFYQADLSHLQNRLKISVYKYFQVVSGIHGLVSAPTNHPGYETRRF